MRWYSFLPFLLLITYCVVQGATAQEINVIQEPYRVPNDGKGDASTGINRALTDAQGTGRTVYLPCGTYRLIAEVLPKSNVVLRGAGECTILAADPSLPIPRPIKVENPLGFGGVRITENAVQGVPAAGIKVQRAPDAVITRNTLTK